MLSMEKRNLMRVKNALLLIASFTKLLRLTFLLLLRMKMLRRRRRLLKRIRRLLKRLPPMRRRRQRNKGFKRLKASLDLPLSWDSKRQKKTSRANLSHCVTLFLTELRSSLMAKDTVLRLMKMPMKRLSVMLLVT